MPIARTLSLEQIRYLIAEGFVPPPSGGRTYATYDQSHVTAIARYERLRDLGFPPAAIRLLLDAREGIPVPVANGVTMIIDPDLVASGTDPAPILEAFNARIRAVLSREAADAG